MDVPLKSRSISMKHQFDTTKLRDLLREKCRIRVKESREKNYNISRNFLADEKAWLADLLKEEFKEFEENIALQDFVCKELMEESYEWLVEQYEKELNYYASTNQNKTELILCPICQISELKLVNNVLGCDCGIRFNYTGSLKDYWNHIQIIVSQHEDKCISRLLFFIEPNANNQLVMNALCEKCGYSAACH